MKTIKAVYVKDASKNGVKARNFANFPIASRTNLMKEPIGFPMFPKKANSFIACFSNVENGRMIKLSVPEDMIHIIRELEDGVEYDVIYERKTLISVSAARKD